MGGGYRVRDLGCYLEMRTRSDKLNSGDVKILREIQGFSGIVIFGKICNE